MTTCYRPLNNAILNASGSDIPCDGANPTGCCGYGDVCMSNGICQSTKPITGGTGYYLQACTDSTFQSPIGQETFHCTTLAYPDIMYNATLGLWACCSSDPVAGVNCSTTTNETWGAPAPDSLASIASLGLAPATSTTSSTTSPIIPPPSSTTTSILVINTPSVASASSSSIPIHLPISQSPPSPVPSTAPTSTTTSIPSTSTSDTLGAATTTTTPTSTTPLPTISAHKPNLSTAAAAGIAAGVALGLIAFLTLAFFAAKVLRARKARSRQRSNGDLFGGPDPTTTTSSSQPTYTRNPKAEVVVLGAGAGHGDIAYSYYNPAHRFTGEPRFPP